MRDVIPKPKFTTLFAIDAFVALRGRAVLGAEYWAMPPGDGRGLVEAWYGAHALPSELRRTAKRLLRPT